MQNSDTFQFKSTETDRGDGGPVYHDYTPYDNDVSREFRVEEPAPPPFDIDHPFHNDAMDLISWAFDQIG